MKFLFREWPSPEDAFIAFLLRLVLIYVLPFAAGGGIMAMSVAFPEWKGAFLLAGALVFGVMPWFCLFKTRRWRSLSSI